MMGNDMKKEIVTGIIVAAGTGSRMASNETKQRMTLLRKPVLKWTVEAFDKCEDIDNIVVVTRSDEYDFVKGLVSDVSKPVAIAYGGNTRADSVKNGISASSVDTSYYAIHDGARCLVTPKMITDVVKKAIVFGAASAVSSVYDTVKTIDSDGFISSTCDRTYVKLAGTPQVFRRDIYERALLHSDEIPSATDDNSLVENIGCRIATVDVGRENIKITEPYDFENAEYILRRRGYDV